MPVQIKSENGKCFARWGDQGKKYYYTCGNTKERKDAKQKAINQGIAIGEFAITKVSFDFDDTLSTEKGQEMAQKYINDGAEVYIITRRQKMYSSAVYEIAKKLSIPKENVYFTNGAMKWGTVKRLGIDKHYDNNKKEIEYINQYTTAEGILFQ